MTGTTWKMQEKNNINISSSRLNKWLPGPASVSLSLMSVLRFLKLKSIFWYSYYSVTPLVSMSWLRGGGSLRGDDGSGTTCGLQTKRAGPQVDTFLSDRSIFYFKVDPRARRLNIDQSLSLGSALISCYRPVHSGVSCSQQTYFLWAWSATSVMEKIA